MPTVGKLCAWSGRDYISLRFNIDGKGEYYCKLPPELVEFCGEKKLVALDLVSLEDKAREILKAFKKKEHKIIEQEDQRL